MALDANKLMKELSSGSKWDTGVTFNRTNPVPIDKSSYFIDINEAKNYALSGKTSYVGQQIFILDDELSTADVYVIQDLSGTLQKTVLSTDLNEFTRISTTNELSSDLSNTTYIANLSPYIFSSYDDNLLIGSGTYYSFSLKLSAFLGYQIKRLCIQTNSRTNEDLLAGDELSVIGTTSNTRDNITNDNTYFESLPTTYPTPGQQFTADITQIKDIPTNITTMYFFFKTKNTLDEIVYKSARLRMVQAQSGSSYVPNPDFVHSIIGWYPCISAICKGSYFTKEQSDERYLNNIPTGLSSYAATIAQLSNDGYALTSKTSSDIQLNTKFNTLSTYQQIRSQLSNDNYALTSNIPTYASISVNIHLSDYALSNDVSSKTELNAKFNSLSTYSNISNQLSNDGYATNAWVNENKSKVTIGNNESPANLSVYKVTAEEYAERIAEGDILSNELYVIDDDYINAFGMQLKNLHNGSDPTDAVTKQQLDQSNSYVLSVFSNAMLSAGISKTTSVDGISYGQALSCLYFIAQQIM